MAYSLTVLFLVFIVFTACSDRDTTTDSTHTDTKGANTTYVQPREHSDPRVIEENLVLILEYGGTFTDSDAAAIVPVIEDAVELLQISGLVKKIDPQSNRCFLAIEEWKKMGSEQKKDIARCLAYYCGLQRGVAPLFWVELVSTDMKLLCKYVHNRSCDIYV